MGNNAADKALVFTQFGPIPRDKLVAVDEVKESFSTREVATVWRLKEPITVVIGAAMEAILANGSMVKLYPGQHVPLEAGQLVRRGAWVDLLMPADLGGQQAKVS